MAVYNLSPLFQPQYAAAAAAKLVFAMAGAPSIVPAGVQYQIAVLRAANITAAPVTLEIWRVPSGAAQDNQHIVVPVSVQIPVASQTFPHFDITALWGAILQPGDSIWALAGIVNAIVIHGDGIVIQQ